MTGWEDPEQEDIICSPEAGEEPFQWEEDQAGERQPWKGQSGDREESPPGGCGQPNQAYWDMANRIITVLQRQLADQQRSKTELRRRFARIFSVLLIVQYVYLAGIILLDAITPIPLDVPDGILQGVIASVFLQTLSAMGVMIAFAFVSKEETWIADMLRRIVQLQLKETDREPEDNRCREDTSEL